MHWPQSLTPRPSPAIALPAAPLRWAQAGRRWLYIALRGSGVAVLVGLVATLAWLAIAIPVAKSALPIVPQPIALLTREGEAFAQEGVLMDLPVRVADLPPHVAQAFIAIEDRRFRSHWGVDPIGLARALVNNLRGRGRQGGSTITQQLAKNVYLRGKHGEFAITPMRKLKEMAIALWLECWLSKDEILERYLSAVQFGANVYGLRAAAQHYFDRPPERLTLAQAVMLAGLVQAPVAYDPTRNLERAQRRAQQVIDAMVRAGYVDPASAAALAPAALDIGRISPLPTQTYFADWAMNRMRPRIASGFAQQLVVTTLERDMQERARTVLADLPLPGVEAALVAMRRDGSVVAMLGGRHYGLGPGQSVFNRATQGRRQPGSTFKLFTYLAALEQGRSESSLVSNAPLTTGPYRPGNAEGTYGGPITLREAFARSSNVAAVRLFRQVGAGAVVGTARDLGITAPLNPNPSLALGTSGLSLLELTAAYAAVAAGAYPVAPVAFPGPAPEPAPPGKATGGRFDPAVLRQMRAMLAEVVRSGTGRAAALPVPAYGKTGTTQDNRDAWFVGYAGDLVVGVWLGYDDNRSMPGVMGGGLPAQIWHRFMADAIASAPAAVAGPPAPPEPVPPGLALPDSVVPGSGVSGPVPVVPGAPGIDRPAVAPGRGAGPGPSPAGPGASGWTNRPAAAPAGRRPRREFIGDDGQPVVITLAVPRPAPARLMPRAAPASPRPVRTTTMVGRRDVALTLDPDSAPVPAARAGERGARLGPAGSTAMPLIRSDIHPRARPARAAGEAPEPPRRAPTSPRPARFRAPDGSVVEVELRD